MAIITITTKAFKCNRCGHIWLNKDRNAEPPLCCAKCKTPAWNRPVKK